jgi:hypothetical protein
MPTVANSAAFLLPHYGEFVDHDPSTYAIAPLAASEASNSCSPPIVRFPSASQVDGCARCHLEYG